MLDQVSTELNNDSDGNSGYFLSSHLILAFEQNLIKKLLSIYYVPSTVLGTGDIIVN